MHLNRLRPSPAILIPSASPAVAAAHNAAVAKAAKAVAHAAPLFGGAAVPNAMAAHATAASAPSSASSSPSSAPSVTPSLAPLPPPHTPTPHHTHHTPPPPAMPSAVIVTAPAAAPATVSGAGGVKLAWAVSGGLMYSAHFSDPLYDYRLVQLPPAMASALCAFFHAATATPGAAVESPPASPTIGSASPPSLGAQTAGGCVERLLTDAEWRALGIQQSVGWHHFGWWPATGVNGTPGVATVLPAASSPSAMMSLTPAHTHKLTLLFRRLRAPLLQLPVAAVSVAAPTATPLMAPSSAFDSDSDDDGGGPAAMVTTSTAVAPLAVATGGAPVPASVSAAAAAAHAVALQNHKLRVQLETLSAPERHLMSVSARAKLIPPPYNPPRGTAMAMAMATK